MIDKLSRIGSDKIFLNNRGRNKVKKINRSSYDQFEATTLFCPKCKKAVPVRKKLLLILPDGDKYDYLCGHCSSSIGTKMDFNRKSIRVNYESHI